jgi:integrase
MNTSSYLKLSRYNVYIFRRRIPISLLGFFRTNELRISTKTRDKSVALHLARSLANESDLLFEHLMNKKNMPDDDEINALKAKFDSLQKKMEIKSMNSLLGRWKETNQLKQRLEAGSDLLLQTEIANNRKVRELEKNHSSALNQQESAFTGALVTVTGLLQGNQNKPAIAPESNLKLSEIVKAYFSEESISRRGVKPATIRKDRDSLKLFVEIVGDKNISDLTQTDAVKFADTCPTYGRKGGTRRAPSTVNGYINSVGNFSGWITSVRSELGHVEFNFTKLRTKKTKRPSEERLAFTVEEVVRILNHPKLLSFKNTEPVKYWLLHIAAYSGARLEEITQLSPMTDINVADDVWIIDINDTDEKSVKNFPSIRRVPIHSELIKNGFLEYIQSMKAKNATTLFPNETIRDGRTGKNAGKRANRFIQKVVGIEGKSLHSFRHTFATILKHSGVNESLAAEIMGHKHGGMTYDRYAKGYLPETLKAAVEEIRFIN